MKFTGNKNIIELYTGKDGYFTTEERCRLCGGKLMVKEVAKDSERWHRNLYAVKCSCSSCRTLTLIDAHSPFWAVRCVSDAGGVGTVNVPELIDFLHEQRDRMNEANKTYCNQSDVDAGMSHAILEIQCYAGTGGVKNNEYDKFMDDYNGKINREQESEA